MRHGLVIVLTLLAAAPAQAATVRVDQQDEGPVVTFRAAGGEANRVAVGSVEGDRRAARIADAGATLSAGKGCSSQPDGEVVCRASERLQGVLVFLSDRGDSLDASALRDQRPARPGPRVLDVFGVAALGGPGADVLTGGDSYFSCLRGGAGPDVLTAAVTTDAPRTFPCPIEGGSGADRLVGSALNDVLLGGKGPDVIDGGGGGDTMFGGGARDRVAGGRDDDLFLIGTGADRLDGGAGNDSYVVLRDRRRADDRLLGGGGIDVLEIDCTACRVVIGGRTRVEDVTTQGRGDDLVIGDSDLNRLRGGRGDDLLVGKGGYDTLLGEKGDDDIRAADGEADTVRCGRGADRAVVDRKDEVRDCETVVTRRVYGVGTDGQPG